MMVIPLKYDFCMKEIMENEIVRKHFISDVLDLPLEQIKTVRLMNTFLWRRFQKQKQGILDIQLELNDNTKVNIEMQMEQKAHWKNRTVFYLAKMFTADLRRSEHGTVYTDVLELHTIELKKKPDKKQPNLLDEWHSLFNAETEEELDMIKSKTKNLGIIEAIKELKEISLTDRLRMEHEQRLKAKRDREAEDEFVFEQGIEKGIKASINIMRRGGYTEERIIEELRKEYNLTYEQSLEKLR